VAMGQKFRLKNKTKKYNHTPVLKKITRIRKPAAQLSTLNTSYHKFYAY
jgi:hypothetical protein